MADTENMQSDLFGFSASSFAGDYFQPLAERVRPRTLDDMAGQEHLVGALDREGQRVEVISI